MREREGRAKLEMTMLGLTPELCEILHLKLRKLAREENWEQAAAVGEKALELAEITDTKDGASMSSFANLSASLAPFGMIIDRARLHRLLVRLLTSVCSGSGIADAVGALRVVVGYDLNAFIASLPHTEHASVSLAG